MALKPQQLRPLRTQLCKPGNRCPGVVRIAVLSAIPRVLKHRIAAARAASENRSLAAAWCSATAPSIPSSDEPSAASDAAANSESLKPAKASRLAVPKPPLLVASSNFFEKTSESAEASSLSFLSFSLSPSERLAPAWTNSSYSTSSRRRDSASSLSVARCSYTVAMRLKSAAFK